MTTRGCCHLPGSLCDCAWKDVEEGGGAGGQPLYLTQVTALDGRLLSSVLKPAGTQSDGPICRICHEGGGSVGGEGLLSPCYCTGTLGTVHQSCLERWLSSSNTSYCELCHTQFSVERRPRPLTEVTQGGPPAWSASAPAPTCLTHSSAPSTVAAGPRPLQREEDAVLRHDVLPLHHAAGGHFGLVVSAGGPGPPPPGQLAAGRGPHHPHHRPLHHLRPVDSGVLPLPLPAVLRVEKNQPESAPAPP
ncbi:unnamed protein product [Tetraodon nigroviridis]|uniref:E3 ubiquitin-protein ligase MARCHF2 n=1 Tax=Tetraodon nigroviridis TaxID=99883 RepID=Q4S3D3_TETNG|nr:unnamed protein product [Tetraodon nigroviridis]